MHNIFLKIVMLFCSTIVAFLSFGTNANAQLQPVFVAPTGEEMLFADDPKDWARPKLIVPPDYPDAQIKAGESGYVDVAFEIDQAGKVISARIVNSVPKNIGFETAVSANASLWIFHAKLGANCVPQAETAYMRVWFEMRDGKGAVSISGKPTDQSAASQDATKKTQARQVEMLNRSFVAQGVRYPEKLRDERIQADTYFVMTVDGPSGNVQKVELSWSKFDKYLNGADQYVINAIEPRLMLGKFAPIDGKQYKVCLPFVFSLSK